MTVGSGDGDGDGGGAEGEGRGAEPATVRGVSGAALVRGVAEVVCGAAEVDDGPAVGEGRGAGAGGRLVGGGAGGAHTGRTELRDSSSIWRMASSRDPDGRPAIT